MQRARAGWRLQAHGRALSSASRAFVAAAKKVSWRRRAGSQRSTIYTATSIVGLFPGWAGPDRYRSRTSGGPRSTRPAR